MSLETMRRLFIFALAMSVSALLAVVITVPLLLANLMNIRADVDSDMEDFKTSTDEMWSDIMVFERSPRIHKRDIPLVYSYKPLIHRKGKRLREYKKALQRSSVTLKHKPNNQHLEPGSEEDVIHKRWGRRIAIKIQENSKFPKQCAVCQNPDCPSGPRGTPGEDGLDGEDAPDGPIGIGGLDAENYDNNGCLPCPAGAPGPSGQPGPPGIPGANGEKGEPGYQVIRIGPPGPPGYRGPSGAEGPPGTPGIPGLFAFRWNSGPGLKGPPGPQGVPGSSGKPGFDGETGESGLVGRPGGEGTEGSPGLSGQRGRRGRKGRKMNGLRYCKCPKRMEELRSYVLMPKKKAKIDQEYPKNLEIW